MWVELVFMMLILKLPAVYLGAVCWYAVRAEPNPLEGAVLPAAPTPEAPSSGFSARRRRAPRAPQRGPQRSYPRVARGATAHSQAAR